MRPELTRVAVDRPRVWQRGTGIANVVLLLRPNAANTGYFRMESSGPGAVISGTTVAISDHNNLWWRLALVAAFCRQMERGLVTRGGLPRAPATSGAKCYLYLIGNARPQRITGCF